MRIGMTTARRQLSRTPADERERKNREAMRLLELNEFKLNGIPDTRAGVISMVGIFSWQVVRVGSR